jgi:pimeloyl-ACP methyl ester carboxylesterase
MTAINPISGDTARSDTTHWIFLRGLTRESRHWGGFVAQFEAAVPNSRVIALDLPGNGLLNQQASPMRVQDMMEHCRARLKAGNIPPPYRLLAMSLGAMVAVAWASEYANEIATQVLINTSMRPFSPFYDRLRPANYGALLKLFVLSASPEAWERAILRVTSNQTGEAVLPHWLALRQANPVSRANALRQLATAARFRAPTAPPSAATLVLASARDRLVSVACSKALAGHWQFRLRIHPSAGHDLPLDDGPWVSEQVRDWLMHLPGRSELQ